MNGAAWSCRERHPRSRRHLPAASVAARVGILVIGVVTLLGCTPHRRRNPTFCNPDPVAGYTCSDSTDRCNPTTFTCEPPDGGPDSRAEGGGTGGAGGTGGNDAGHDADRDDAITADAGDHPDGAAGSGAGGGAGADAATDGPAGGDATAADADAGPPPPPMCPPVCGAATPICDPIMGKCVACASNDDCLKKSKSAAFCETGTGRCVGCRTKADCADQALPICDLTSKTCVACQNDTQCHTDYPLTPTCNAGPCVECVADKDCPTATKSFCSTASNVCMSCGAAGAAAAGMNCANRDNTKPVCGATGACVECGVDADCNKQPTRPFCSAAGACVPCAMAPAGMNACRTRAAAQPVCATSGACVQCVSNTDCASTAPVCAAANTCGPCTADADCAARPGPGVCMSHQDGRCASPGETIYVENQNCSDTTGTNGGTSARPFCTLQPAVAAVGTARDLVVVRGSVNGAASAFQTSTPPISIVGQMSGLIGGVNPAIHVAKGDLFARDLTLTTVSSVGCQADAGATVRLDRVLVTGNAKGGILLDGAAFVITNSTVTNNGPGDLGFLWGGIRAQNIPVGGPAQLTNLTVQNNNPQGISCSAVVVGTSVLATNNLGGDISTTCGFVSCAAAGPTCGATP